MPRSLYYISDEAYDGLWRSAVALKYVGRGASSGKGISQYITEAAKCKFVDDRPEEYKEMDAVRKAHGLTLYWEAGSYRKARQLTLDEETIDNLCIVAVDHLIGIGKSHPNNLVMIRTTTATIARVMEAIGMKWLIPATGVPVKKQKVVDSGS